MVSKDKCVELPLYTVRPGWKIAFVGLCESVAGITLLISESDNLYYCIIGILAIADALFYWWLYISVRIQVYRKYLIIRNLHYDELRYSFEDIYLIDKHINRWYGTNEHFIADANKKRIITISGYFIRFDDFCRLMKRKKRAIR